LFVAGQFLINIKAKKAGMAEAATS
jgi:hypothetical protein